MFFISRQLGLGPQPSYHEQPLHYWVQNLVQGNELVQRAGPEAAEAVKQIGPAAVPFLLDWMPQPIHHQTKLEELLRRIPFVKTLIDRPHSQKKPPVDSQGVLFAFFVLGTNARSALPFLAQRLGPKQDHDSWDAAREVIPWIGPDALPVILTAVTNLQAEQINRYQLIETIGMFGSNAAPAIPALLTWAKDPDSWTRMAAIKSLGGIGKQPELVIPVLRNALRNDSNLLVRREAANALGSFGPSVVPDLLQALNDAWDVPTGAVAGLGKLAVARPEIVLPILQTNLVGDNRVMNRATAYALGSSGSKAAYDMLMSATNVRAIRDIIYQTKVTANAADLK